MTTYNTGNPIGSKDPRDLYDNAENLDVAVNDDAATWVDRLGVQRSTLWQMLEYSKQFNDRGDWHTSTAYARKDYFTYNGVTYVTLTAHTSTSVAADLAAGKIGVMSGNSGAMDFLQAGTGAVARSVESKLRDFASVADFNGSLSTAIVASDYLFVNSGIYDGPINIAGNNKVLVMGPDVTIKLPNSTVKSGDLSGPPVIELSGDNIVILGDFTVDGNRANNDSSSFPTSVMNGSLTVSGNNCKIFGTVVVKDAYYRGFTIYRKVNNQETEVDGFFANSIEIIDPNYYAALIWGVKNWRIDGIISIGGTPGASRDQRVRIGTNQSAPSGCKNGSIGYIYCDKSSVVFEPKTDNIRVDSVVTSYGKFQESNNVSIGYLRAINFDTNTEAQGWGWNACSNCSIEHLSIEGYNCKSDFTSGSATIFADAKNCYIGTAIITGTIANKPDVWIIRPDGLHIGFLSCTNPQGTGNGLFFDAEGGAATERDVTIGQLVSRGHTNYDLVCENATTLNILKINNDAKIQYPSNSYDAGNYKRGFFYCALTSDTPPTNPISLLGYYTVHGNLVTIRITGGGLDNSGASGVVKITGLPYKAAAPTIGTCSIDRMGTDPFVAYIGQNKDEITFRKIVFPSGGDISWSATGGGTSLHVNITYEIV